MLSATTVHASGIFRVLSTYAEENEARLVISIRFVCNLEPWQVRKSRSNGFDRKDAGKTVRPIDERPLVPDQKASWASMLLFIKPLAVKQREAAAARLSDFKVGAKQEVPLRSRKAKYDESLTWALHKLIWKKLWLAGFLKLLADGLTVTSPLVTKALLDYIGQAYVYANTPDAAAVLPKPPGQGTGWGLAIGLWGMMQASSLLTNQFFYLAMYCGLQSRASLTSILFRKGLRLSSKSRLKHTTGRLVTAVSTDVTRLETLYMYAHDAWLGPIQIVVTLALLINNLGPSALVALGVIIFFTPFQAVIVSRMVKARADAVKVTDKRVSLMQEILQGIKLIILFEHRQAYAEKVSSLRSREIHFIRSHAIWSSLTFMLFYAMPIISATLTFMTYKLSGHDLDPAIVFSSLQLLNIIKTALVTGPLAISSLADAHVALGRISKILLSEENAEENILEGDPSGEPKHHSDHGPDEEIGLSIKGTYAFESVGPPKAKLDEDDKAFGATSSAVDKTTKEQMAEQKAAAKAEKERQQRVNARRKARRAREEAGEDVFTEDEEEESEKATDSPEGASPDPSKPFELKDLLLEVGLGKLTVVCGQIGSGKSALLQALVGDMRKVEGETHFAGRVGYHPQHAWIQNMSLRDNVIFGAPVDQTRFQEVVEACALRQDIDMLPDGELTELGERGVTVSGGQKARISLARVAYSDSDVILMDDPISAVDAHVVFNFLATLTFYYAGLYASLHLFRGAFRGVLWSPLGFHDVTPVGNSILLGLWSREGIDGWSEGQYLGLYAGFGAAQAVFNFLATLTFYYAGLYASLHLFRGAFRGVLWSPLGFHDVTPVGRIISRLSKDVDQLDYELPMHAFSFLILLASVFGTVGLTIYAYNWLGLMFPPLFALYLIVQTYYRRTSREAKRLESILRSFLYASFMEALDGIATVRAFKAQERFVNTIQALVDTTNSAYMVTIAAQRWLSVRVDAIGNVIILGIGLASVGFRESQNPATLGVVLSYATNITTLLSSIVAIFAEVETQMNSVERLLHYTTLSPEGQEHLPQDPSEQEWPLRGAIDFESVQLRYREGLPLVLNGFNASIRPGERIGIVGRTGSGKSTLLAALFRTVDLAGGSIRIDDIDVKRIGLATLRHRLAIVPQDTYIFESTLRDNLDPTGKATDQALNAALRAVGLLQPLQSQCNVDEHVEGEVIEECESSAALQASSPSQADKKPSAAAVRFQLDLHCRQDSFSAGQKQLIGLARALVKDSRIIVLDEATASVDAEADANVQHMIHTLRKRTLLIIAHRLHTVAAVDRILVMKDGQAVEFDDPLTLFDRQESTFRDMCDQASLTRGMIMEVRAAAASAASRFDGSHQSCERSNPQASSP
ncbi:Multidrug resistance-associated protein/mitoxantrone resistance protein, ABC superfamily [Ceraceosorus bombacis]|uniref:Multidrug resistance-associated protein/mitoxantrone resistance protein, ABC superfamily n=1 Tax=Ceraceosorus bombacis TaxID=401625 RepID=A0A0P1BQR6_9BASI|nr:Multidrug resistance-associated protein/mitoxantrone resistance protein, ABC superfamily [Ceraceosorus bombacis]